MSSCMHEHEQFSHSHHFFRLFCSIVSPLSHSLTFFSSFLDYVHSHLNFYCCFLLHSSHFLCLSIFVLIFCLFPRGGILVYNTSLFLISYKAHACGLFYFLFFAATHFTIIITLQVHIAKLSQILPLLKKLFSICSDFA